MKLDKTQRKVCFTVSDEQYERVNNLRRGFNLSQILRAHLDDILNGIDEEQA